MKPRYRLFRRKWGVFYAFDTSNGNSASLKTRDKREATRQLHAFNEADREPVLRKQVGLIYLAAADPDATKRTWQDVMDTALQLAQPKSRERWGTAVRDPALRALRSRRIIDTRADDFLLALRKGGTGTNVYLRRLQNLAINLQWLVEPVVGKKIFPKPVYRKKRAITLLEHQKILEREPNQERRDYYEVLWHTGGAQTDIATLDAFQVDWDHRTLTYRRRKTGQPAQIRVSDTLAEVLRRRPASGPFFPSLAALHEKWRAGDFRRRCKTVGIQGITLHSYRYSWAERAKSVGYPIRYAQQALGHSSKAVAEAYAAQAVFILPSLEEYERKSAQAQVIVPDFSQDSHTPTIRCQSEAETRS